MWVVLLDDLDCDFYMCMLAGLWTVTEVDLLYSLRCILRRALCPPCILTYK